MVDFSGHGVPAALNSFRLQAYLKDRSSLEKQPGEYLSSLNEKLLQLQMNFQFSTMFYCIIDTKKNHLLYSTACNPNPFIIVGKTGKTKTLDGSGVPLGISETSYPTKNINFLPGDIICLYSDALTETADASGEYFSEDAIMRLIAERKEKPAAEIMHDLLTYFKSHYSAPGDDLTLCLCKRN